jgi:OOP family OmpA-OmpF porin
VKVLMEHPEILKIRVEGHTDSQGGASYNKRLSKSRAKAVESFLVEKGIAAERISAEGFGESRLLVSPEVTDDDLQKNRRVEFHILKRDKTPDEPGATKTGN